MSDPTAPPPYRLAHVEEVHVTATATAALSTATKCDGLKSFKHAVATTLVEIKNLNGDGFSTWVPVWKSGTGTLEGECQVGSATQAVLSSAVRNSTLVFITTIDAATAAVGAHKGWRFAFYIESTETPREAGSLVTFNYPLKMNGGPVELLGTAS